MTKFDYMKKRCCHVMPVYYGDKSAAFRGNPFQGARDYYFECSVHFPQKSSTIKELCRDCKDYYVFKIDPPRRVDKEEG